MNSGRISSKPKQGANFFAKKSLGSKPTSDLVTEVKHRKLREYINAVPSFLKKY